MASDQGVMEYWSNGVLGHQYRNLSMFVVQHSITPILESGYLALNSCTASTMAITCSTGVSGKTPWPRLKIWPGLAPARRKNCRTGVLISFGDAYSVTGSRFPWKATS